MAGDTIPNPPTTGLSTVTDGIQQTPTCTHVKAETTTPTDPTAARTDLVVPRSEIEVELSNAACGGWF